MKASARTRVAGSVVFLLSWCGAAWAAEPLQLDSTIFQTQLEQVPADTKVLLEFYAHWCPACQRFSPEYEHLAAVLNAEPKPEPKVLVARVDCAEEVRQSCCPPMHAQPALSQGSIVYTDHACQKAFKYTRMPDFCLSCSHTLCVSHSVQQC